VARVHLGIILIAKKLDVAAMALANAPQEKESHKVDEPFAVHPPMATSIGGPKLRAEEPK
jgi:hypothetical protein